PGAGLPHVHPHPAEVGHTVAVHQPALHIHVGPEHGARVLRDRPMLLAINQQQADVAGWLARLKQWLPAST
ncbi:hypothetical protein BWP11_21910, partial [Aeromonas hydrophila]|uniref:hypothetical protein n=1 Tax=Aeromonas hydrophila TaxID=644 RepID=UPI0009CAE3D0